MVTENTGRISSLISTVRQRIANIIRGKTTPDPDVLEMAVLKSRISQLEDTVTMLKSIINIDQEGNLKISSAKDITIEAINDININRTEGQAVLLTGDGNLTLNTPSGLVFNGSMLDANVTMLTANTSMARFNGVVEADSLIANSVIAASYSPGAGNIV